MTAELREMIFDARRNFRVAHSVQDPQSYHSSKIVGLNPRSETFQRTLNRPRSAHTLPNQLQNTQGPLAAEHSFHGGRYITWSG